MMAIILFSLVSCVSRNMSIVRLGSAPTSREAFIIVESYVCKVIVLVLTFLTLY